MDVKILFLICISFFIIAQTDVDCHNTFANAKHPAGSAFKMTKKIKSKRACGNYCATLTKCQAWTYNKKKKKCLAYDHYEEWQSKSGYITGICKGRWIKGANCWRTGALDLFRDLKPYQLQNEEEAKYECIQMCEENVTCPSVLFYSPPVHKYVGKFTCMEGMELIHECRMEDRNRHPQYSTYFLMDDGKNEL